MRSCFGTELFPASFHFFFFCQFLFPVAISSISLKTTAWIWLNKCARMQVPSSRFAFAVLLWVFRSAHGWARGWVCPAPVLYFRGSRNDRLIDWGYGSPTPFFSRSCAGGERL